MYLLQIASSKLINIKLESNHVWKKLSLSYITKGNVELKFKLCP